MNLYNFISELEELTDVQLDSIVEIESQNSLGLLSNLSDLSQFDDETKFIISGLIKSYFSLLALYTREVENHSTTMGKLIERLAPKEKHSLEKRAEEILNPEKEEPKEKRDLDKKVFLFDFISSSSNSATETVLKTVLIKYLIDENPFPNITKKRGRPKLDISDQKILESYLVTKSQRKTAQDLNVSPKFIREKLKIYQDAIDNPLLLKLILPEKSKN
ncbi:hypothetical protein tloyanaT_20000 [Thalassotalea loyana]|uniref:DNA binding HTH domain-containing protein n=1 Tax=Thalassotalea loyana TaxID=280483 RepID=A0ABQ6HCC2_9GAMM|nr:hypothetical protein [Thalassotalea loyana]GLX85748.1 hypothetical protein tloyanaT_20000 [Thalassotalea loyana]